MSALSRAGLLCALLALTACGGGAGAPPGKGRELEERAGGDPGTTGFWEPMVEDAVRQLATKVSARGSGQRPRVRLHGLTNATSYPLDVQGVGHRIESSLEASGRFELVEAGSWAAADDAAGLAPAEQVADLRLTGRMESQRRVGDQEEQVECTLTLRLVNPRDGGIVALATARVRQVRPLK